MVSLAFAVAFTDGSQYLLPRVFDGQDCTALPVNPWKMTLVSLSIRRFAMVLSYAALHRPDDVANARCVHVCWPREHARSASLFAIISDRKCGSYSMASDTWRRLGFHTDIRRNHPPLFQHGEPWVTNLPRSWHHIKSAIQLTGVPRSSCTRHCGCEKCGVAGRVSMPRSHVRPPATLAPFNFTHGRSGFCRTE